MDWLEVFDKTVETGLSPITGFFDSVLDKLNGLADLIGQLEIVTFLSDISTKVSNVETGLANVTNTLENHFNDIEVWLDNLDGLIQNSVFTAIHDAFYPMTYKEQWENIEVQFYDKFRIIAKVRTYVERFISEMEQAQEVPPDYRIEFNDYYGVSGSFKAVDLSWYEPYRKPVKGFISALLWGYAVFHCMKAVPRMLGGVSHSD